MDTPSEPAPPPPTSPTPPAPWAYDPGPSASEPRVARVLWLAAGGLALFALGVVVGIGVNVFGLLGPDVPVVIEYGSDAEVRDVDGLRKGACLAGSVSPEFTEYEVGARTPCTDPHRFEAFGGATMPEPEGGRHDTDELAWLGTSTCHFLFPSYVGAKFEESSLALVAVVPSEQAWRDGERTVRCLAFDFEGGRLEQPVRDSGI